MEKTKTATQAYSRPGCDMCKHCGVTMGIGKDVGFICRFEPPRVIAQLMPTPDGPSWIGMSFWPTVGKTDWCSRFAAIEH